MKNGISYYARYKNKAGNITEMFLAFYLIML